ncbi:hypothetical protein Dimus_027750 [Dionaea muscipula]
MERVCRRASWSSNQLGFAVAVSKGCSIQLEFAVVAMLDSADVVRHCSREESCCSSIQLLLFVVAAAARGRREETKEGERSEIEGFSGLAVPDSPGVRQRRA